MGTNNRNPETRLWLLLAKKIGKEATQDELIELEGLMQKTPAAHYAIEILSLWWKIAEESGIEQADKAVMDLLEQMEKENKNVQINKKGKSRYLLVA